MSSVSGGHSASKCSWPPAPGPYQPGKAEARCRENGDGFFIRVPTTQARMGVGDRPRGRRSHATAPQAQREAPPASAGPARGLKQNQSSLGIEPQG